MSDKWKEFHERLHTSMKQEIGAMREMLANMRQEEVCLLAGDRNSWNKVMVERSSLLARLYELRSQRFQATQQLEILAKKASISFENFLCQQEGDGCEILSMREQLTALVEKMNQQNLRNSSLEAREFRSSSKDRFSLPPLPAPEAQKKGKTTVATYPDKP